jgi:Xaa-Pro aminopeptidase
MKLADIQEQLRESNLDGWLFFDHHQRDPLAYRILGLGAKGHVSRRWYFFIPAKGEPRGLVHRIEARMLDELPGEKIRYSTWQEQAAGIEKLLGDARRIAMQYSPNCAIPYVSLVDAGTIELVRASGAEIVSSAELVQYFEARLDRDARESHFEAGRRVDPIRKAAFDLIRDKLRLGLGTTEIEVHDFVQSRFAAIGLVTESGPIVGVNAHAGDPHYEPSKESSAPIGRGDFVLLDMWAKLDQPGSVYYDITWTGFCGTEPPARIREVFEIVRDGRNAGIQAVKSAIQEGRPIRGFEVDDATRNYIGSRGYAKAFVHRTGHSIGQEIHGSGANMDNFETHDERRIIPGLCFSIEPGIYLDDFGVRSEIDMFVDESSASVTGEMQDALVLMDQH